MFVNQVLSLQVDDIIICRFDEDRQSPLSLVGVDEIDIKALVRVSIGHSLHSRNQEP
jgi:hypothetical protein